MSHPATITAAVFEKILAFLAPLFLIAASDLDTAREAAGAILASYGARTDRELRFAALSIAFGFGALEALSRASDPALALNQVLRLRGNANALNRAAQQNETRLEKLRKQPPVATETEAAEVTPNAPADALPASSATADLLAFARSKLKSMMGVTAPAAPAPVSVTPLSRQQRRDAERKAEKVRQRQLEEARRAQRAAERTTVVREPMRQGA
jgi:hypothetical protein